MNNIQAPFFLNVNELIVFTIIGLQGECTKMSNDLDADDEDTYSEHRIALEMYGFLLYWYIATAEDTSASKSDVNRGTTSGAKTKVFITNYFARK